MAGYTLAGREIRVMRVGRAGRAGRVVERAGSEGRDITRMNKYNSPKIHRSRNMQNNLKKKKYIPHFRTDE